METRTKLHPLLTAAAISVSVFSAVGVAAITGLVPSSIGSQKTESAFEIPEDTAKAVEPAISQPAAPQPAAKPVQRKPAARAAYGDYAQAQAPKPVVKPGYLATIQAVREVKEDGQHTALGPIAGGIAGAVLGDQLGKGHGSRKVITLIGAAGGALAGREIEQKARARSHWEIDVRRDDGSYQTVRSDVQPPYQPGERVRLLNGTLQPV